MLYFHTQSGWMLLDEMDISRIRNAKVVSSIPIIGTNNIKGLREIATPFVLRQDTGGRLSKCAPAAVLVFALIRCLGCYPARVKHLWLVATAAFGRGRHPRQHGFHQRDIRVIFSICRLDLRLSDWSRFRRRLGALCAPVW